MKPNILHTVEFLQNDSERYINPGSYFCKKFYLKCLTVASIRLCLFSWLHRQINMIIIRRDSWWAFNIMFLSYTGENRSICYLQHCFQRKLNAPDIAWELWNFTKNVKNTILKPNPDGIYLFQVNNENTKTICKSV